MNNYSDQQLPINFNNYNQFQNDESLHSSHPSSTPTSTSSTFNLTPDKQPNTIKERLNLHVKRKILENSVASTTTTTAAATSSSVGVIGNCTITSQQYQQLNQEKLNNNLTKSPNIIRNNSITNDLNTITPKRKRRAKKIGTISGSTLRSVSRTGGNIEDSQDGNLSCHDTNSNSAITNTATTSTTNSKTKDNKKEPDILAQILNQKKLALMRDPEIIELFNRITKKLENNKNSTNQVYQS